MIHQARSILREFIVETAKIYAVVFALALMVTAFLAPMYVIMWLLMQFFMWCDC